VQFRQETRAVRFACGDECFPRVVESALLEQDFAAQIERIRIRGRIFANFIQQSQCPVEVSGAHLLARVIYEARLCRWFVFSRVNARRENPKKSGNEEEN
jgi:hypothetical protein